MPNYYFFHHPTIDTQIPLPDPAPQQQQHPSPTPTVTRSSPAVAATTVSSSSTTASSLYNNTHTHTTNNNNHHHHRRRRTSPSHAHAQPPVILLHESSSLSSLSSSSSSSTSSSLGASPCSSPSQQQQQQQEQQVVCPPPLIPSSSHNVVTSSSSLSQPLLSFNDDNSKKHHRRISSKNSNNILPSSSWVTARRRNGGGMIFYPPIVGRNSLQQHQKSSKPHTFLTLLLIFLPFMFTFLYTVDIRTHGTATSFRRPSSTVTTIPNSISRSDSNRSMVLKTTMDTTTSNNSSGKSGSEKTPVLMLGSDDDGAVVNVDSMATTAQQTSISVSTVSTSTVMDTDAPSLSAHASSLSTERSATVVPVAAKNVDGNDQSQQQQQQLHSIILPPPSTASSSISSGTGTTTVTSSSTQAAAPAVSSRDVQKLDTVTRLSLSSVSTSNDSSSSSTSNNHITVTVTNNNMMINPNNNINNPNATNKNVNINTHANGIPPPMLPKHHPNHDLLNTIRARTQMTPRWPMSSKSRGDILKTYGQAFSSMLVSHKLKAVYIPVFKVATTSMMWNIAVLENNPVIMEANRTEPTGELMKIIHDMSSSAWHPSHTLYDLDPEEISKILDDPEYLKFGFVRNPYDRIVSAYVDKVIRPEISDEEYQDQMYSLYGNDSEIRRKVNETRPSFLEFLQQVKEIMERPRVKSNDLNSREAYEDNMSRRDMHWRPQVELLHPDIIHLDFVGHFNRINEDAQVIVQWMYRNTDRRLPKQQRARRLHSTDPKYKEELLNKLGQDEKLRNLLLTIYKEDFSRFHFSTDVPTLKDLSSSSSSSGEATDRQKR